MRGSFLMMFSAVASGALAYLFWALTARRTAPTVMGEITTEISTITFLAGVGSLNLINVYARFLPVTGWRTRRFVLTGYAAALLTGTFVAGCFLLTPWASSVVLGGDIGKVFFVALVVSHSVFMIQDGALLGLGRPSWIPLENVLVAITRFLVLPVSVAVMTVELGVLVAWGLSSIIAVVVVNALILGKLAPEQSAVPPALPPRSTLLRFVLIESVTTAISSSLGAYMPALVAHRLGSAAGAVFYVPWIIITMITLLLTSTLISMVREIVANPQQAQVTMRRSMGLAAVVIGGSSAVCLLVPQLILWPLGPSYVEQGSALLRWLALALLPASINLLFWSTCLVRSRAWPVFGIQVASALGLIGGLFMIDPESSVSSVGLLYFLVQSVIAVAVLVPLRRALRAVARGEHSPVSQGAPA